MFNAPYGYNNWAAPTTNYGYGPAPAVATAPAAPYHGFQLINLAELNQDESSLEDLLNSVKSDGDPTILHNLRMAL